MKNFNINDSFKPILIAQNKNQNQISILHQFEIQIEKNKKIIIIL
jgi:hypothetical protein